MKIRGTCTIEGCGKPHFAFGLCPAHYTRNRRHGDPLGGSTSPGAPLQFLCDHVEFQGDECITWPFGKGRGCGIIMFRKHWASASRVMCILAYGEPPTPLYEAAHSCGKGHEYCVNPNHLRWATSSENKADKIAHGTHLKGESIGNSVLTETQVRLIRASKDRVQRKVLAKEYGVKPGTISAIQARKIWAWVSEDSVHV